MWALAEQFANSSLTKKENKKPPVFAFFHTDAICKARKKKNRFEKKTPNCILQVDGGGSWHHSKQKGFA